MRVGSVRVVRVMGVVTVRTVNMRNVYMNIEITTSRYLDTRSLCGVRRISNTTRSLRKKILQISDV